MAATSAMTMYANDRVAETKALQWSYLRGLDYRLKAGVNIGGTSPIPLPVEIRHINDYNPTLQMSIEGDIIKWFSKWGLCVGFRIETKGMETDANTKNYKMKMVAEDGGVMEGYWTGNVVTKAKNSYLTVPITAQYKVSKKWELKAGAFFSYLTKGSFTGHVYDGYLRENDPTGEKVVFEDGAIATYDFSKDQRHFQCGPQVGAEWRAFSHLNLYADLTWGVIPNFKGSFETITFNMYPIYLTAGFAYVF